MSRPDRQGRAPRRWFAVLLRVVVSAALIALCVKLVGGDELVARLRSCDPLFFLAACALFLFGQLLNALRWRWLLETSVAEPPSLAHLMALVMVGMFFNMFMPSTVGGDVVRAELVRERVGGRTQAYLSILVGRILAFAAVLVIGLVAMAAAFLAFGWADLEMFAVVVLFFLPIAGLWLVYRSAFINRWWSRVAPPRITGISSRVVDALDIYRAHPAVLRRVFVVAIVANLTTVCVVWALAAGLGIDVPFYFHLIAVPLIIVITLIPISFNGIGLREGAFAYFYANAGVSVAASVSLSLTFTAVLVVLSLVGGLCLLTPGISWPNRSTKYGTGPT